MPSPSPQPDLPSSSELRASLLGRPELIGGELDRWNRLPQGAPAETPPQHEAAGATARGPAAARAQADLSNVPPSADEVLIASPAVVRLCESYHRAASTLLQRSRRQRIGIFGLVAALSLSATVLSRSGTVTADLVSDVVLAVAGSSCASLALLALLWMRDQRSLRSVQGERLLRALQSNCTLPSERITLLRSTREPDAAFFDCYSVWRLRYQDRHSRLTSLLETFRGTPSSA